MAPVIELSDTDIQSRLERLLTSIGLSAEQFAERSRQGILTDEEWDVREELGLLLFLSGSDVEID